MLCGFVGNLQLTLNGPVDPTASEWTSYMGCVVSEGTAATIGLVHTLGGGPSAAQRQETSRCRESDPRVRLRCAVLTDVAFHRAFIATVNLFERVPFKAFASRELGKSLAYLGASITEADARQYFTHMARMLGITRYCMSSSAGRELPGLDA